MKIDLKEIKNKSKSELLKILTSAQEELRELKFKVSIGSLKKVNEIRLKRKHIARVLTLINTNEVKLNENGK
ncbi:50S ribosomal protein L29 [Patescibacteria group bacterium]|nr:50S ribosomal protein L29 [Patescibacteria group bacterium]